MGRRISKYLCLDLGLYMYVYMYTYWRKEERKKRGTDIRTFFRELKETMLIKVNKGITIFWQIIVFDK